MESEARRRRLNGDALEDRINSLPDELKMRIADLLPKMLPLVMPRGSSATAFHNLVDRTLRRRIEREIPIHYLYLGFKENCDYDRVYQEIATAVRFSLQILELSFPPDRFQFRLSWYDFSARTTLVSLTLTGKIVLDVPPVELGFVHFPSMKNLSLIGVCYRDDNTMVNLFNGSPLLQNLDVNRSDSVADNNLKLIEIKSTALIRLKFVSNRLVDRKCELKIKAPNLQHIYLDDRLSKHIFVYKSHSFVEAFINTGLSSTVHILKGVSSVSVLKLGQSTLEFLDIKKQEVKYLVLPSFPNLVRLEIVKCPLEVVILLLASMPHVEDIKFSDAPSWPQTPEVPTTLSAEAVPHCLTVSVRRIDISTSIAAEDLRFLAYILQNCLVLESLKIKAGSDVTDEVMQLHKASRLLQVDIR